MATAVIKEYRQVKDLSHNHALWTVDWEIRDFLEDNGLRAWVDEAQSLFVLTGDGEIEEVWVCHYSVPQTDDVVTRVF